MTRTIFFPHVAASVLVTVIVLLIYVSVQQTYRTAANDPQVEIARNIAAKIKQGRTALMPNDTIDLAQSLSTFVQLYDAGNYVTESSGFYLGKAPVAPAGVLEEAKKHGENQVTWQPYRGIRIAAVVEYTGAPKGIYVLAGRSLLEIEKREANLRKMVFMCWLLCVCIISSHGLLQAYMVKKETGNKQM